MPYGFLCCGPSTVYNVIDTSDEESDGEAEVQGVRLAPVISTPEEVDGLRNGSGQLKRRSSRGSGSSEEPSFMDRVNSGLQAFFSPRPRRRRNTRNVTNHFSGEPQEAVETQAAAVQAPVAARSATLGRDSADLTVLNLAYRETHRLPDVAGKERVEWAAGILRIDLTETGIRTLRGLDAFPNVQTLVLDGNGLLSLPDCPWVPSLETLWLCNNDVENLDGVLCQVNDTFPRLTALALMGNPVWPALSSSKPRKAASTAGHSRRSLGEAERAGGHKSGGGEEEGGLGEEEAMFRIRVLRRLPGLQTLDCTDVTDEERLRASQEEDGAGMMDVTALSLEPDATTDVEESLSSKILEDERVRRSRLPDRSTLPSTWSKEAVVMDVGSGWTKVGLAGRDRPSGVFPTIVGRMDLRVYDRITGQDEKVYVGHNAVAEAGKRIANRELPTARGPMPRPIVLNHPLEGGIVTNWDDMEQIWRHGIEDVLRVEAMEHPILMADSTATPPGTREKATEVLFESLASPAMHMALQPVLALYACGPSSGLVVDIGDSGTQIAPIYDGFLLEKGVRQLNLGGKDVTRQLAALVNAKVGLMEGEEFETDKPMDILKLEELKAEMCFVSENVDKDNARMELSMTKPYTLPDGTKITLGRERYRCSELLFDPAIALRPEESLQTSILDSILACERKTWAILAQTVILTGGTTELTGLNRRLQRELTKARRASGIKIKFTVMVPEDDHNNTVWLGGSMLASSGQLDGLWFTRSEYEEYGAGSIHAKFAA